MSNFEIKGKLLLIENEVQVGATFKKREFVIEVENERNAEWNDFIKFQLTQDKCDLLNTLKVGDSVDVSFNIRGRKWEKDGKVNYFSNLECWKLYKSNGATNDQPSAPTPTPEASDDLPF